MGRDPEGERRPPAGADTGLPQPGAEPFVASPERAVGAEGFVEGVAGTVAGGRDRDRPSGGTDPERRGDISGQTLISSRRDDDSAAPGPRRPVAHQGYLERPVRRERDRPERGQPPLITQHTG